MIGKHNAIVVAHPDDETLFAASWPKVKAQGWIGGHDYDLPGFEFGVKRAVDEWVAATGRRLELGANYTWWVRK
jgi:hypothetical protein